MIARAWELDTTDAIRAKCCRERGRPGRRVDHDGRETPNSCEGFLSFVLRHKPEAVGIGLDAAGWVDLDPLLQACAEHGHPLSGPNSKRCWPRARSSALRSRTTVVASARTKDTRQRWNSAMSLPSHPTSYSTGRLAAFSLQFETRGFCG